MGISGQFGNLILYKSEQTCKCRKVELVRKEGGGVSVVLLTPIVVINHAASHLFTILTHLPSHSGASNMMIFFVHPVQLLTLPDHSTRRCILLSETQNDIFYAMSISHCFIVAFENSTEAVCLLKAFPSRRIFYKIDVPPRAAAFAEQVSFFNSLHSSRDVL